MACTAACIHLVFIWALSFMYRRLAVVLTNWELWPTRSEYNNALTVKLFMLQFTNYYSAVFYIAYFKGRCASQASVQNSGYTYSTPYGVQ